MHVCVLPQSIYVALLCVEGSVRVCCEIVRDSTYTAYTLVIQLLAPDQIPSLQGNLHSL